MKRNRRTGNGPSKKTISLSEYRKPLEVIYPDSKINHRFDFWSLGFSFGVAKDLASAFRAVAGAYRPVTRGPLWGSLKLFAEFAQSKGWKDLNKAPASLLEEFARSLNQRDLQWVTKINHYRKIRLLLAWLARNRENGPWRSFALPHHRIARGAKDERPRGKVLQKYVVKRILRACYREIDQIWANFEKGQRLVHDAHTSASNNTDTDLGNILRQLHHRGGGRMPTQRELRADWRLFRYRQLREYRKYLQSTAETLLPFFIAICLQTAGNPMAILAIRRDCLRPHGLDKHRLRVVWSKPRALADQERTFDVRRKHAAPNLINKVLSMTAPLVPHASASAKEYLFLHARASLASNLSNQAIHDHLAGFCRRNKLPNFDPVDLRATVAALEQQDTNNIRRTKRILNHRDIRTTIRYVQRSPVVRQRNAKLIHEFQGSFVHWVKGAEGSKSSSNRRRVIPIGTNFETVFGFRCRDPLSGIAPGSRPKEVCLQFFQCAICPQAIVIVDDPMVAARLLQVRDHLGIAQKQMRLVEGGMYRFREAYEPLLKIVVKDLLPRFSKNILKRAGELVDTLPLLPQLE